MNTMMMFDDVMIVACAVFGVTTVAVLALMLRRKLLPIAIPNGKKLDSKSTDQQQESTAHDPWQERLQRGIFNVNSSSSKRNNVVQHEKPFQSSYYYAHNNPQAKGGYIDGLRMEDYTMNQPRLLSRNTDRVVSQSVAPTEAKTSESSSLTSPTRRNIISQPKTHFISRYLWDDPGKSTGIAYIRIEQLPVVSERNALSWGDFMAHQSTTPQIDISLTNHKSLRVMITSKTSNSENDDCLYELRIDALYGDVERVETTATAKRLNVKLYKEIHDNKNKQAWPHPYQSKTKAN